MPSRNRRPSRPHPLRLVSILLLGSLLALATAAQEDAAPDRFEGNLVDLASVAPGTSTFFRLHVDRYADDATLARLAEVESREGRSGLRDALWDEEAGWLRIGDSLGYPVAVVTSRPAAEGRRVVAVTDRPIQLYEVWNNLRSRDYPFTVLELDLDENGEGEGRYHAAAAVHFTTGGITFDSLHAIPIRLLNVEQTR